jgi:hypothetical protein
MKDNQFLLLDSSLSPNSPHEYREVGIATAMRDRQNRRNVARFIAPDLATHLATVKEA